AVAEAPADRVDAREELGPTGRPRPPVVVGELGERLQLDRQAGGERGGRSLDVGGPGGERFGGDRAEHERHKVGNECERRPLAPPARSRGRQITRPWRSVFSLTTCGSTKCSR